MAEWVTLLGQSGVVGALALWLWVEQQRAKTEREERLAVQKANDTLRDAVTERMLTALNDVAAALRDLEQSGESTRTILEGINNLLMQGGSHRGNRGKD